jgi:hypothetical protein
MTTTDETRTNGYPQVNGRPQQTVSPQTDRDEQPATAPTPAVSSANTEPKRVQRLRAEVAEARGIVELQTDPALTEADTSRVLTERRKAAEALKLHNLDQDPARKALRDNRVRRAVALVGGAGLVGALGWSTANVQHAVTAGQKITAADPAWWMAFLVEPMVSVGLLLIFGVRAYIAATRGYSIEDHRLRRVELALLGITLTVNSWDYLPFIAPAFDPLQLLVHSIGPVVAVLLVTMIPVLWQYLSDTVTSGNADPELGRWLTLARQLIADGVLPPDAGRNATERALREHGGRISTATANRVYRCLTGNVSL